MKKVNILLFLTMIFVLTACKGQQAPPGKSSATLGEEVQALPDRVWSVFEDSRGHYWFGSNGKGLYRYDGTRLMVYTMGDGLVDNTIRGIQEDHLGHLYISTPEGVSKYDGLQFTTLEVVSSFTNEWKLEENDLWFNCNGNPNDVYRYDGDRLYELRLPKKDIDEAFGLNTGAMRSNPYAVFGVQKDRFGHLWIGTVMAGAYRYDGNSFLWFGEKELSQLEDGRVPGVRAIVEDKNGYFWLSNLLHKYKPTSDTTYQKHDGIDINSLNFDIGLPYFNNSISDKEKNLWFVKYGNRLMKYDGDELSEFEAKSEGPEILLMSIIQDSKGRFWLGTDNDGVYTFDGLKFQKFNPAK